MLSLHSQSRLFRDVPNAFGTIANTRRETWRQLCGAGALGGIGFTMSLFIAGVAFPDREDYAAAKIAIFLASLIAGFFGVMILWPRLEANERIVNP